MDCPPHFGTTLNLKFQSYSTTPQIWTVHLFQNSLESQITATFLETPEIWTVYHYLHPKFLTHEMIAYSVQKKIKFLRYLNCGYKHNYRKLDLHGLHWSNLKPHLGLKDAHSCLSIFLLLHPHISDTTGDAKPFTY